MISFLSAKKFNIVAFIIAVITASLIASYTLLDGIAVRSSENPFTFIYWMLLLNRPEKRHRARAETLRFQTSSCSTKERLKCSSLKRRRMKPRKIATTTTTKKNKETEEKLVVKVLVPWRRNVPHRWRFKFSNSSRVCAKMPLVTRFWLPRILLRRSFLPLHWARYSSSVVETLAACRIEWGVVSSSSYFSRSCHSPPSRCGERTIYCLGEKFSPARTVWTVISSVKSRSMWLSFGPFRLCFSLSPRISASVYTWTFYLL